MARSRFFPVDDVTAGEWIYLRSRFPAAEADDRRSQLRLTLKRLTRKGIDHIGLHQALMAGIDLQHDHASRQQGRKDRRQFQKDVEQARKDVARALASLRRLIPAVPPNLDSPLRKVDDDDLFLMRDLLLGPENAPALPPSPVGRPRSEWKNHTDQALRALGIIQSDRRELLTALGFLEDE